MEIMSSKTGSSGTLKNDFLTVFEGHIRQVEEYLHSAEVFKDKDVQLGNANTLLANVRNSVFQREIELSSKLHDIKRGSEEIMNAITKVSNSNIYDSLMYDITAEINQLQEYLKHIRGLKKYQVDDAHSYLISIRDEVIKHAVEMSCKLLTQEFIENELTQIIKSSKDSNANLDSVRKELSPLETEIPSLSSAPASVTIESEYSDESMNVLSSLQKETSNTRSATASIIPNRDTDEPVLESSLRMEKSFLSNIASQIDKLQIYLNDTKFLKKQQLDQCFDLLCNLRQIIISHETVIIFEMQKEKFLRCELTKIL